MNCSKDKKKSFQIWIKVVEGIELPVKIRMPSSSDLENKVLQELADALEMGGKGNDYQAQSKDRYNNCDSVNVKLKQE